MKIQMEIEDENMICLDEDVDTRLVSKFTDVDDMDTDNDTEADKKL